MFTPSELKMIEIGIPEETTCVSVELTVIKPIEE